LLKNNITYYCTYFDINYVSHGLSLHKSLLTIEKNFTLFILCMDVEVYELLNKLDLNNVELIKLSDFESNDPDLLKSKKTRSIVEYYFTCTPCLILYVLNHYNDVHTLTYLDADLYFFSDPQPIFEEISNSSISLIEHRYSKKYQSLTKFGIYNVGLMTFRKDKIGLKALSWWRTKCIEWCYKRLENGKYADQKYLDDWATRFEDVKIIQHKGANLGAWNIENYTIDVVNDNVIVDSQPLIFFHFHAFEKLLFNYYGPGWPQTKANKIIRENIYKIYLDSYLNNNRVINKYYTKNSIKNNIYLFASLIYRLCVSGNYVKNK
jgi:hypothetical protein